MNARPATPRSPLRVPRSLALVLLVFASCEGVPVGKVLFGELQTHGEVDQGYLEAQMVPLEPRFQACYAQSLRRNHSSEGVVRLSLRGGGGKLIPSVVENSTGDEGLARCVSDAIAGLSLVQREGTAPWAFTAEWSVEFESVRRARREEGRGAALSGAKGKRDE
ncbi:MAG: hypothetical protein HY700_21490 [Gemmatimonadetes bacterium]|nr:hypothetical protein [Gemmatimonadota bacterium]